MPKITLNNTRNQTRNQTRKQNSTHNDSKWVVITGASAGIGEELAYILAEQGYNLVLLARRLSKLKQVQKQCLGNGSVKVEIVQCDLSKDQQIKLAVQKIEKLKISPQVLVNNAGLASGVELVQNADLSDWQKMFDTNVKGLLWMSRYMFKHVIRNNGHIVNVGSVAGRLVYEGGAVYCATKFAVRALSEGFRMDLKGTGVRVTNIEPGMVNSEFSLVRLGNQQKADAVYADMMPLSPKDIAQNILWCLQQPPHVNIQELVIYPTDQASVGQVVRGEKSVKNIKNIKKIK